MRRTQTFCRSLPLCLLSMMWVISATAVEIPDLWGRVVDHAGMLSPGAVERLEGRLTQLEQETGAQVVVLTVQSLEGLPVEDYSMQAVEKWQLGREEADDGVLILIAKRDRKMRIEVGYGLEGSIPDITAGRIISELMAPYFRQGNFDAGIEAAVAAVDGKIRGEAVALQGPRQSSSGSSPGDDGPFVFMMFLLFGGLPMMRDTVIAKPTFAWIGYVVIAALTLALYGIVRLTPLLILGALWLVVFPILRFAIPESTRRKLRKQRRRRGRSAWIGGSGGGFSGGGFSGGGGSFGGGGASGSW